MATELESKQHNTHSAEDTYRSGYDDDDMQFRSVSRAAVASIVFAILGLAGLLIQPLLGLLLLGIGAGVIGLASTIRYPEEITGRPIAIIGIVLCSILFVGAVAKNTHEYLTEVPDDCVRLTWRELQPPKRDKTKTVSDRSVELNGEKIFIEGYVLKPTRKTNDLNTFILVRDIGACCFGDSDPKPTHIVKVEMPPGKTVDWNARPRKLTGYFHVEKTRTPTEDVKAGVYYSLRAETHK